MFGPVKPGPYLYVTIEAINQLIDYFKKHNNMTQDTLNQLKNLSQVPGKWDIVDNQIDITLKRNYEDELVDKIYVACKKLNINFDKCVCIHS
jgi:hypothetical protein